MLSSESYESFSMNRILDTHWGAMTDSDVSSCMLKITGKSPEVYLNTKIVKICLH